MASPLVRVMVSLSAEEHEALIRKYPHEPLARILRRLAAKDVGIDISPRKSNRPAPMPPEQREFNGETVRVPHWWRLVETLERAAGGHFFAGDVREWPKAAHIQWTALTKQFPDEGQWERLGVYLREHPPKNTLSFRFGMSSWAIEQMQFAHAAQSTIVAERLKLLEKASNGRFMVGDAPSGPKARRLANRVESDWKLLGEWLAAGGFNWMWEKMGEKAAGVAHIEKWGDEMFARSLSWAAAGRPALPAPKLNGLSAERAQHDSAYKEVDAKALLMERR